MKYGKPPIDLGKIEIKPSEYCFALYMPIFMGTGAIKIPDHLLWCGDIVGKSLLDHGDIKGKYVYLTAKYTFISGYSANRPDWHSDGFLSDDINYVWCDSSPTEYCIQDFDLSPDHEKSIEEMNDQARQENIKTYGNNTLLKLDQSVIHRVAYSEPRFRAFCKVSISENRYNLEGNAHNYLFDYNWPLSERSEIRNHPSKD